MFQQFLALTLILITSSSAFAFRKNTEDTAVLKECQWNKDNLSIRVDCSDLYQHYHPAQSNYRPRKDLRMAGYNILRTSQEKGKKDLHATARMIHSQWDLVALSEVQPGRTVDIIESFTTGPYILPEYIKLLQNLQNMDPSWGLILSPFSQGSDAELFGFLYRADRVRPVPSSYCENNFLNKPPYKSRFIYRELNEMGLVTSPHGRPINDRPYQLPKKALACPLAIDGLHSDYMVKIPFTSRFQSGNFEFSYISLHYSFRGIDEFSGKCMGRCQLNTLEVISTFNGQNDNSIARAIRRYRNQASTQKTLEVVETNIPSFCSKGDDKSYGPDNDALIHENCQNRLMETLQELKAENFLPDSCKKLMKDLDNEAQYKYCAGDFKELRQKTYRGLSHWVFENVIRKHVSLSRNFSGVVTTLYEKIGEDLRVSTNEGRYITRFYQMLATMMEANKMFHRESSDDVIIAGDFNLEVETEAWHWRYKTWEHILNLFDGGQVFIDEPTTINRRKELTSNYDHFIFSPKVTEECDLDSIEAFNFLTSSLDDGYDIADMVMSHSYPFVLSDHLPIAMTCSTR